MNFRILDENIEILPEILEGNSQYVRQKIREWNLSESFRSKIHFELLSPNCTLTNGEELVYRPSSSTYGIAQYIKVVIMVYGNDRYMILKTSTEVSVNALTATPPPTPKVYNMHILQSVSKKRIRTFDI